MNPGQYSEWNLLVAIVFEFIGRWAGCRCQCVHFVVVDGEVVIAEQTDAAGVRAPIV